jgi:hypothetical protein
MYKQLADISQKSWFCNFIETYSGSSRASEDAIRFILYQKIGGNIFEIN